MSWTAEIHIGELRPWPDVVRVVRGKTEEMRRYVPERTCRGSFHKSSDLSSGKVPLYYCKNENDSIFVERSAKACPICGAKIEVSA